MGPVMLVLWDPWAGEERIAARDPSNPGISGSGQIDATSTAALDPTELLEDLLAVEVTRPLTFAGASLASSKAARAIMTGGSPFGSSTPVTSPKWIVPGVGTTRDGETAVTLIPSY